MEYKLQQPFKYGKEGEQVEAEVLSINAPSNKVVKHAAILETEYYKMLEHLQKNDNKMSVEEAKEIIKNKGNKENIEKISGKQIIMSMFMGKVDVPECIEAFKKILIQDYCKVDDAESFTNAMFEKMSYEDIKIFMGEYISNFLAISLDD